MKSFHFQKATYVAAFFAIFGFCSSLEAQQHPLGVKHVPDVVRSGQASAVGQLETDHELHLVISLPLRNEDVLDTLLQQIYDPQSPNFHHYLTSQQFTDSFGPSQQDYDTVVAWAKARGLQVTATTSNRRLVEVDAPAGTINRAFNVVLKTYQDNRNARTFHAPDREPTVDLAVPLMAISGLDDTNPPHSHLRKGDSVVHASDTITENLNPTPNVTGSGPSNTYLPSDMRAAYYGSGPLDGSGQTVAIFSFDDYLAADLNVYFTHTGMTSNVPVTNVYVNGYNTPCFGFNTNGTINYNVCDDGEQILDIVNVIGMAPGLTKVLFYEGFSANAVLNQMAIDNTASVISSSWGGGDFGPSSVPAFKQFQAQGQTFLNATGDDGEFNSSTYDAPSVDPNITQVGGTDLKTMGAGGPWSGETGWADSGGGFMAGTAIPTWQQPTGVVTATNKGSTTVRNTPDVAAEANFDNTTVINGKFASGYGGTSFAAPRWAGFIALANQQSVANGNGRLGFLNPTIYNIGLSSTYTSNFHDITSGLNKPLAGAGTGFPAVAGYDLVTGWGSPNGTALIASLAGSTTPDYSLAASPNPLTIAQGSNGTTTVTITDIAGFAGSVALSATLPTGVTASFSPTSTTGASTMTITVSGTAPTGLKTVTITGTSGSFTHTANLSLNITSGADYSVSASPTTVTAVQGGSTTSTITIAPISGFSGPVALSASGLPAGVTASFSPASATTTSKLTLTASNTAILGQATVTVTGTSGTLSHTTTVTLTITPAPDYSLSASPVSVVQGNSGTSTISVSDFNNFSGSVALSASGLPAGVTASFSPASATTSSRLTLTASGTATLGPATVTITGTSGSLTHTATVALTITPAPDYSLSASPASVIQGSSGTSTISVTDFNNFSGSVALSASGMPAGVTASFSPASATTTSKLTLTASNTATLGQATVTVTGTSGSLTHTTTVALTITPAPDYSLSASPANVIQGSSGTSTISVTDFNNFSGPVALSASGLPAGVTASFSPASATTSSRLTLTASGTATLGPATVTITGTSGSLTHTATVALTITPAPDYSLSASPANVIQGSSGTSTISVTDLNNFSGSVALSASGMPAGVTASFSPASATTTSKLILTASNTATLGQATVTVTGTSGTLSHTTTVTLTVTPAPDYSLSASPASVIQGSSGTSTISVTDFNNFSGSVALSASGMPAGVTASFSPASATTSSRLTLTASDTATLGPATVTITGTSGSLTHTATVALTITPAPDYSLSASPASVIQGSSGTSTISVTDFNNFSGSVALSASGMPAGVTASFSPASATTTSKLTLTASNTATLGQATVTVTGTSGSLTHTTTVALTITPAPDYSLSASPSNVGAAQGFSGTSTVTVTDIGGFSSAVALTASGLPSGVTASFSPSTTIGSSLLTFTASSTATLGSATVTITGTSGSLTHTTTVGLTITPAPDYSLSASPANIIQGSSGNSTISVTDLNNFSGPVALSASGLPAGVTASFSPASATTSSRLTLTASGTATLGSATVTITGTSGSLTHTATVALTITAAPDYSLSASPSNVGAVQGFSGTSTVTVTDIGGFSSAVALTASGLPSGVTASFSPSTTIGSSLLTFTASSTATLGSATVTITGTSGSLTHTTTVGLTITPAPDYSLSASPVSVVQGTSGSSTVAVTDIGGFSGVVGLSVNGLPAGVTASFSPASTTGGSVLTLTASGSATVGPATVTITGTSGNLTHTATVALTITAAPDYSLSASAISVAQGNAGTSTIMVTPLNSFAGSVALSARGLPVGVTGSFSPASTTGGSVLTLTVSDSATLGPATVTITGTSGSLTHTTTVALTVTPAPGYSLSAPPVSVASGAGTTDSVTVASLNGFTGTVALSCSVSTASGNAAGSCSLAPASVAISSGLTANSVLTINATAGTAGVLDVTVTGTSGSIVETSSLIVVSVAQVASPGFTVAATPGASSVVSGASATSSISVASTNGFAGKVSLACSVSGGNAGSDSVCTLAPASVMVSAGGKAAAVATLSTMAPASVHAENSPGIAAGRAMLACLLCLIPFRRRKAMRALAALLVMFGGLAAISGCGSGGTLPTTLGGSAGTYTVTITGTGVPAGSSNAVTASTTVTLTVE